jgi:hypothetical protein
MVCSSGLG